MSLKVGQLSLLLLLGGLISAGTVAAIVIATNELKTPTGSLRPEVALPILLVAGLIALVAALAILVGTFSIFGLSNRNAAFGVPDGTLQAVIAMMIIMIFAITSLYLNASLQTTTFRSTGISQSQLAGIPSDEIRSIAVRQTASGTVYDVERAVSNRVGEDFAKQLLTTLSTLVVAIAGFYFGAKSVESGVAAAGTAIPANTALPVISGEPRVGSILTAEPGSWTGSPPPTYAYQWQRCDPETRRCSEIPGATSRTYAVVREDLGKSIRVAVTASNSAGTMTVESAPTEAVTAAE